MKTKWSKNFYWWLVAVVALIATLINAINEMYFIAGAMAFAFLVAGTQYLKYRRKGE